MNDEDVTPRELSQSQRDTLRPRDLQSPGAERPTVERRGWGRGGELVLDGDRVSFCEMEKVLEVTVTPAGQQ